MYLLKQKFLLQYFSLYLYGYVIVMIINCCNYTPFVSNRSIRVKLNVKTNNNRTFFVNQSVSICHVNYISNQKVDWPFNIFLAVNWSFKNYLYFTNLTLIIKLNMRTGNTKHYLHKWYNNDQKVKKYISVISWEIISCWINLFELGDPRQMSDISFKIIKLNSSFLL